MITGYRSRSMQMVLGVVAIAALLLAACGGQPAPGGTQAPTPAAGAGLPPTAAEATAAPTAAAEATAAPTAAGEATAAPTAAGEATAAPTAAGEANAEPTAAVDPAAATAAVEATIQAGVVSKPEEGKENVTWWTHNNQAFVAANKEMIKRFEAANPGIHIVYQFFPYDIFINKLQTAYASSTEPDIQQMFGTWVTDYAKKGLLAEVPIEKAQLEHDFWPAALGAYVWEGKAYGMPHEYNLENGGMLINTKMFKEAGLSDPKSWDDILTSAKKLTQWDGDKLKRSGFAFTNNDSITFLLLSLILQQGGSYWDKDGQHVNFNTPEAQKAWEFETGLETKEKLTQERAYDVQLDTFDVFFQGQAALGYRGPWVIGVAKDTYPDLKFQTDYDYIPVPSFVPGKPPLFAAESGWGEVVSNRSQHKDAAFKFMQFMAQADNARDWNITTFTVPALQALKDDPKILQTAPALKTSFEALQYGQWVGPVQNRDRFWQIVHDHYTAVVLGKESAADSPAKLTSEINAMIDEYLGP
jgi:multiple sugar transport system substrate-binding protein